jgi:hypothetical protein
MCNLITSFECFDGICISLFPWIDLENSAAVILAILMTVGKLKLQELEIPFCHLHNCHQELKLLGQEVQDIFQWLTLLGWVGRAAKVPKI